MPSNTPNQPVLTREVAGRATGFPLNASVVQNPGAQVVQPAKSFTVPAIGASVTISVSTGRGLFLGQIISVTNSSNTLPAQQPCYYLVTGFTGTTITMTRLA